MPSHRPPTAEHLDTDAVLLLLGHVWTSPWFSGEGLGSGAGPDQRSHKGPAGGSQRMQRPQDTWSLRLDHEVHPQLVVTRAQSHQSHHPDRPGPRSFRNSRRMLKHPGPV